VAELVDAARGGLIGSVRFRRWKWCSTNAGSSPALTTLSMIVSNFYYTYRKDFVMSKSKNVIHTLDDEIYKGMKRQDIIDDIVQSRFDNMDDDILFDILENGHTGYSEFTDDELIEEYQEVCENDCGYDDDDDELIEVLDRYIANNDDSE